MATQFDTWLGTLGAQRADMPMTVRGLAISHTVTYPGNVTSATLAGSVKASPDATAELAVFSVSAPTFDGQYTVWTVSLTAAQTASLPADTDLNGTINLLFDFLIALPGGSPERLFGGLFPVSGFITEPV